MTIERLRAVLKEMNETPEIVLQVLLEQGWITPMGNVAKDLEYMVMDVADKAFADPIGPSSACKKHDWCTLQIGHEKECYNSWLK